MTTRAQTRAILRETLPDRDHWPDNTLNAWIADALHDLSSYFPITATIELTVSKDNPLVSLVSCAGIISVHRVEYPAGKIPSVFLYHRAETSPVFYGQPTYTTRGNPPAYLVLGNPSSGGALNLTYSAAIPVPLSDSETLQIKDEYLEAVKLFVQWQAIKEFELQETANPSENTEFLTLANLGINAVRAERLYRQRLAEYRNAAAPSAYTGPWTMDSKDRIY